MKTRLYILLSVFLFSCYLPSFGVTLPKGFVYINNSYENANPLFWDIDENGNVIVNLVYDHERNSLNRANGHWNFQLLADKGSAVNVILQNFTNYYNDRPSSPLRDSMPCYISYDGKNCKAIKGKKLNDQQMLFKVKMETAGVYLARLEPYTVTYLNKYIESIKDNFNIDIIPIGKTVQGRDLEIIQVGKSTAPCSVFIRGRVHPWEPGGNWVIEGLIDGLLGNDPENQKYLARYCVYVLPIANKDGVANGRTRFSMTGMDLNRNMDKPADPELSPENYALEQWIEKMISDKKKPDLAIDFHNDGSGRIHYSWLKDPAYQKRMDRLERLLREHTWFTEGTRSSTSGTTITTGFTKRYKIDAIVYELNADWIAGLNKVPGKADWKKLGKDMRIVLWQYFQQLDSN